LYSSDATTMLDFDMVNTQVVLFSSVVAGSLIYVDGTAFPTIYIDITDSSFQCKDDPLWQDPTTVFTNTLDMGVNNHDIGNAIYIEEVSTAPPAGGNTLTMTRNAWKRCYVASDGAIYYLPENSILVDTDSSFAETAGELGGVIFCDSCTATFQGPNTYFEDNNAIDGGIAYMKNQAVLLFDQAILKYGKARRDGGAIYAVKDLPGNQPSSVTFQGCSSVPADFFQYYQCERYGGFFYVDNDKFDVISTGCNWVDLWAG